jgi:hypothetical protein
MIVIRPRAMEFEERINQPILLEKPEDLSPRHRLTCRTNLHQVLGVVTIFRL